MSDEPEYPSREDPELESDPNVRRSKRGIAAVGNLWAQASRKTRRIIGLGVAVAVVAGLVVIIVPTLSGGSIVPEDASSKLSSYFDALESGNAERALELVDPGIDKQFSALLNNKVFEASKGRITKYKLSEPTITEDGKLETYKVTFTIGGEEHEQEYSVAQTDDGWKVNPVQLDTVVIDTTWSHKVWVNGIKVDLSKAASGVTRVSLPVFPGSYKITLPKAAKYVTAKSIRTEYGKGDNPTFSYQPTDELQLALNESVTEFMDDCIEAEASDRSASCPNWFVSSEELTDVKWSLAQSPDLEVVGSDDGESGLSVEQEDQGILLIDYKTVDPITGQELATSDARYFGLVIDLSIDEGKPSFSIKRQPGKGNDDGPSGTPYIDLVRSIWY